MKPKRKFLMIMVLALLISTVINPARVLAAPSQQGVRSASISFSPFNINPVMVGDAIPLDLTISVANIAPGVGGADIYLSYNPVLLSLSKTNGAPNFFGTVNVSINEVLLADKCPGGTSPCVHLVLAGSPQTTKTGVAASFQFNGIAQGTACFSVTGSKMVDADGFDVPFDAVSEQCVTLKTNNTSTRAKVLRQGMSASQNPSGGSLACTSVIANGIASGIHSANTDQNGEFLMDNMAMATYTVRASYPGYLDSETQNVIVDSSLVMHLETPTLVGGDVNGDGAINILDIGTIISKFGQAGVAVKSASLNCSVGDESADINDDGMVNIGDLAITAGNWGKVGSIGSITPTPTFTPTFTFTPTPTGSPTITITPTFTFTPTPTGSPTITITPTFTFTPTPTVSPTSTPTTTDVNVLVSSVLVPFNVDLNDLVGPSSWPANYGKIPEIIVASNGVSLDVLAQDYDSGTAWNAVLLHIQPNTTGGGYKITQALTNIPMLDRIMGLAIDEAGNRYYATGVDEGSVVNSSYPPLSTYRSNIVRVIKLNLAGEVQFNIDLDLARNAFSTSAEMIINPMTAATSRLAIGGNELALVHGINTAPDWNLNGARHQKALSTRLNATNGAITQTSSIWVSHSFDQRLLYDGSGIIENHLGDAYPRDIVFGRNNNSYSLFHIKGALGENLTATRLGNIALVENNPTYGYISLFATESSTTPGDIFNNKINGPRNLAIVQINRNDNSIDPNLPDTLTVSSAGSEYTNRLRWLTQYSVDSNMHAERPKLIGIGGNQYMVLWEEWTNTGSSTDTFNGVYGMLIDNEGIILRAAKLITNQHHLPRGDDGFFLDDRAAWMTGNAAEKKLYIHFVDAFLNYEMVTLD